MAYYTGRDVDVFWSTEHDSYGIKEEEFAGNSFELERLLGSTATTPFVESLAQIGLDDTKLKDVTGVDLSIGAQDEDISYMGLRNQGKIEVKKDTSVTITMKKKDRHFLQLYQGSTNSSSSNTTGGHPGRWGLIELSAGTIEVQDGTIDPKSCVDAGATTKTTYGFRLIVEFKGDTSGTANNGACIIIPNCTLSEVTHTTSNEAADEESVTFTSSVKPIISNAQRSSASTTATFHSGLRTATNLTDV
jgi:hypothetical protein